MWIERKIELKFNELIEKYPVVTLMGPRQSGKTSLARKTLPDYFYFNLEDPSHRRLITQDPKGFLEYHQAKGIILDEIQHYPELLSYIQVLVDEPPQQNGKFILTGSYQLVLHDAVAQSLAGRTALLHLYPFTMQEIANYHTEWSLEQLLIQGFYPSIYQNNLNPTEAYQNYVQTYVEKDVRQIMHLKDLNAFQNFLKLCAGRLGQPLNLNQMSNDIGISSTTLKQWLSLLEASYIVMRLPPYFENFGKRIIKSPKLYFVDVGLACFLLDIHSPEQLFRDPMRGPLFENLVVMDLIKEKQHQGKAISFYYFRDQHGNEVDLVIKSGNRLTPVEIKASKTFLPQFTKGIEHFKKLIGERYAQGYLVYSGETYPPMNQIQTQHYRKVHELFDTL